MPLGWTGGDEAGHGGLGMCIDAGFWRNFEPGEEAAGLVSAFALHGGYQDEIPLETLGTMDGHEVDGIGLQRRGGVEILEAAGEIGDGDGGAAGG